LGGDTNSTITLLPDDDYLIAALRVAFSLADQICKAEAAGQSLPTPSTDWMDSIVVHLQSTQNSEDDLLDGEGGNNIQVEILPSSSFSTTENNNQRQAPYGILYPIGLVFYEIFSRGERPAELELKQVGEEASNLSQCQHGTEALSGDLDTLPFDQGGTSIDLAEEFSVSPFNRFDDHDELFAFDDLQDEYNDIWGNSYDIQEQRPKKKVSRNNNNSICSVSVEPLKAKGIPGSLRDLLANMLDVSNGALRGEDAYRNMSDVRDDLQLMLDKPSIYLHDQDMGTPSTTGLQFSGSVFGRKAELSTIIEAYRRSVSGESELVTISGQSGTGIWTVCPVKWWDFFIWKVRSTATGQTLQCVGIGFRPILRYGVAKL
jgi:hypothetical protein